MNAVRSDEICEAVQLLHDLNKTPEFIARQLDLTIPEVLAVLKTGQIPAKQKTLFADEPSEPQKTKPVSRWDGVKRALEIHPAGKPKNQ